ncbi:hypothetical protein H0H92_005085 [Tricholoma furcatifolium]|nr:hypothetical protein H0H92_005085 [Tricholoma furcatifolium]
MSEAGTSVAVADSKDIVFTSDHKAFFRTFLTEYKEHCSTKALEKGDQGQWVIDHVLPVFVEKFTYSVSQSELIKKLKKWFTNHKGLVERPQAPPPKPRALNAKDIFVAEKRQHILALVNKERERAGDPTTKNLKHYNNVKQSEWDKLSPEERNAYQERANTENEKNQRPDPSMVFERQKTLGSDVVNKLRAFCGEGWGGCGDVVLFVQGAYRDNSDKIQTFTSTVTDKRSAMFSDSYMGYKDFREEFFKFADKLLPRSNSNRTGQESRWSVSQKSVPITFKENGFPALAPSNERGTDWFATAEAYIQAVWAEFSNPGIAVPWESLHHKDRSSMGLVPHPEIDDFETLDPNEMTTEDVRRLCRQIFQFQEKNEVILQFFSVGGPGVHEQIEEVADHDVSMDDISTVDSSSSSKKIDFSPPIPASNVATSSLSTSSSARVDFSPAIPGPPFANAIPGPTPMASNASSLSIIAPPVGNLNVPTPTASNASSQLEQPSITLSIIAPPVASSIMPTLTASNGAPSTLGVSVPLVSLAPSTQNTLETEEAMDTATTNRRKKKVILKFPAATAPLPETITPLIVQVAGQSNEKAQNASEMAQATVATVGVKGGGKTAAKRGGKKKLNSQDVPAAEPRRTGRKRTRTGDSTPKDPPTKKARIPASERYAYVAEPAA